MSVKRPTPPPGLGTDGRRLWRDINTGYELAPHELAVLAEACRVTDRLTGIATALADAPLTVAGSTGQPRAHPLLAEARMQARVLESLARALAIPLPNESVGRRRSPTARENAMTRWRGDGAA
jgi:hypothetical protein